MQTHTQRPVINLDPSVHWRNMAYRSALPVCRTVGLEHRAFCKRRL